MENPQPIVIFDGVCNFCNASVNFLLKHDKHQLFRFTANQEPAGQDILLQQGKQTGDVDTLYLYHCGKLYDRSDAALRIAGFLPFPWNLARVFLIIPRGLRNLVYNFIARNRYKWWGKREACRIPTPEERARFI